MHRLTAACVAALLLAPGCAGPGIPQGTDAAPPQTPPPAETVATGSGVTLESLRNATYRWDESSGYTIQLRDGKFRGPLVSGSLDETRVSMLDRIGRGDLDGDGVEDAAVVLVNDPGGAATFFVLVAVLNRGGAPDPIGNLLLGDGKIQVGGITIEGGKIFVDVVRPAADVPSTAPTRRIKESYKLVAGRLERADTFR